ncbi:hypothetical protein D0817_06600 [Flavobacterium cupreum]|uniref:Uncharacterized protein n=2 Tax=Flavobacterium TaxID=237 RepID=A0A4Y7UFB2_9FLAO|nr:MULTISPECIES: hypothetical protein [Flavobacterium]RUT71540.1 hypothetical protein D0817_06600 [Flavobacterium cupreum]TCN59627.1 hypothetical protein EV142_102245 [Flavobacterium circumlabens]TEB44901.1 hypothetical protein D0809_06870 [Flavobacterium circumlabens]
MENKTILERLREVEIQSEIKVVECLKETENKVQSEFFNMWKNHDSEQYINIMFNDLKLNIEKYWLNEKYNKEIEKEFNMIYFEHSGLYGGEFESYAIDFNYINDKFPKFEIMDKRITYLENISCFPACIVPLLNDLTREIQGKEDDFDDWDDVMDIYNLFESSSYIEAYQMFLRADKEKVFSKLNFKTPLYLAVGEHDGGAPNLIYVIK